MRRSLLSLVAALALLMPASAFASKAPISGTFTIAPTTEAGATGAVQVTLSWDQDGSRIATRTVALSRLGGLVADGYGMSQEVPVRFTLDEDAGTFAFVGTARTGRAEGRFTFEASTVYANQVERRVMDRPTSDQLLALALQGTTLVDIDAFAEMLAGRARAQVVDLMVAGVTPAYVVAMEDLGYRNLSAGQLIALRSQGVTPGFIRRVQALGYARISADQVLQLHRDGVSAAFIRQANEGRRTPRSVNDLVSLRRIEGR